MAKKALINREAKRVALAKKYAAKRAAIFAVINDAGVGDKERFEARLKLQAIPRNASPIRQRRRCALTGRPRVPSVSLAWGVLKFAKLRCVVRFLVLLRPAGKFKDK